MDDINTIYYNDFGIAFQWKRNTVKYINRIQLVFKNTGLFLNKKELLIFSKHIDGALKNSETFSNCSKNKSCEMFLLEGPNSQLSFVMNTMELNKIQDLVQTTLFQLGLDTFLEHNKIQYN